MTMRFLRAIVPIIALGLPFAALASITLDAGFPVTAVQTNGSNPSASYTAGGTGRILVIVAYAEDSSADPYPLTLSGTSQSWTLQSSYDGGTTTWSLAIWTATASGTPSETITLSRHDTTNGTARISIYSFAGASSTIGVVKNGTNTSGSLNAKVTLTGANTTTSYYVGFGAFTNSLNGSESWSALINTSIDAHDNDGLGITGAAWVGSAAPATSSAVFGPTNSSGGHNGSLQAGVEIQIAAATSCTPNRLGRFYNCN